MNVAFIECKEAIEKLKREEKRLKFELKEIEETKKDIIRILVGIKGGDVK